MKNRVPQMALKALLYEVVVNPKPGLVDPTGNECHPDMDVFTFIDSSLALENYFEEIYQAGRNFKQEDLTLLFKEIRPLGIKAEQEMFLATHGVNTHKGAIFSLGVLLAALGYIDDEFSLLVPTVRKMLKDLTKNDFAKIYDKEQEKMTLTAGERQYLSYGIKGIRGEAEAGFPTVMDVALPFFRQSEGSLNQRFLDTLIKIASNIEDSTLIKRAGDFEVVKWLREKTNKYFELGGAGSPEAYDYLLGLNQEMNDRMLSLGGAADLLIITIFLALVENPELVSSNLTRK